MPQDFVIYAMCDTYMILYGKGTKFVNLQNKDFPQITMWLNKNKIKLIQNIIYGIIKNNITNELDIKRFLRKSLIIRRDIRWRCHCLQHPRYTRGNSFWKFKWWFFNIMAIKLYKCSCWTRYVSLNQCSIKC